MTDSITLTVAEVLDINPEDVGTNEIYKCLIECGGIEGFRHRHDAISYNMRNGPAR